jgi:hypothetical protein
MVTLAGLEPATSPAPGEQGRSIPLELQRRHDLHERLWRRRGGRMGSTPTTTEQGDARAPLSRRPWSVEVCDLLATLEQIF